jgi:hypothetical protein
MKYYNLNGTLVVTLTTGLEVQFALETVEIDGWVYQKLYAAFTFDSPYFEDNPALKIPLTKQQATQQYLRFRAIEYPYRNCCEIWWKNKRRASDSEIMQISITEITEGVFDLPKPVRVASFFWQKPLFAFALN